MTPLCIECNAHRPIQGSRMCADCLNDYIRRTRPASLRVTSPWVQRMREGRGVAKVLG